MLLDGFCRVIEAERQVPGPVGKYRTTPLDATADILGPPISLAASPNPMRDRIQFVLQGPASAAGVLDVYDVTGRKCLTRILVSDAGGRARLDWDGADDAGRRLPSGAYRAVAQTGGRRTVTGFAIIR